MLIATKSWLMIMQIIVDRGRIVLCGGVSTLDPVWAKRVH